MSTPEPCYPVPRRGVWRGPEERGQPGASASCRSSRVRFKRASAPRQLHHPRSRRTVAGSISRTGRPAALVPGLGGAPPTSIAIVAAMRTVRADSRRVCKATASDRASAKFNARKERPASAWRRGTKAIASCPPARPALVFRVRASTQADLGAHSQDRRQHPQCSHPAPRPVAPRRRSRPRAPPHRARQTAARRL
jgi:hypothetical protein